MMKGTWGRVLRFVPLGLWYSVIFRFSAQSAAVSGALSDRLLYRLLERWSAAFRLADQAGRTAIVEFLSFYERKGAHMALYFVLLALALFALADLFPSPVRRGSGALALCALAAAADEFHQTFIPGRSGQVRDVAVDLAGAACCLLVWYLVRRVRLSYRRAGAEPEGDRR